MWHQKEEYAGGGKPVDDRVGNDTADRQCLLFQPLANEIVFRRLFLQASFYDPESSDAENYGGIGVVIGRGMTHGFDDQGRNLRCRRQYGQLVDTRGRREVLKRPRTYRTV